MIPDEIIDRIREEADIVSIIGEYVKLKRVGSSQRGPCPFHHGKDPNFSVTSHGYNCFVCHESGSVFTFVQKHLGLDFVEAVKFVGARCGIDVPDVSRRLDERDSREPLWEVNNTAADFFRHQLWDAAEGRIARDYLESRGLSRDDSDRFGLGYAPRDGRAMPDALRVLGFEDDRQIAAGVLVLREDNPAPRPRFRGRLMFPIHDAAGHMVGFGGRILGDGEPKYLNSAESEVFSKRRLLYGLNWAKQSARKSDRIIVVEGYFDAIRLSLAGISEVVAPMGTALTAQQAGLIRKYTRNVFLLYDSDRAGLKATFRSGDELLSNGAAVRVVTLPEKEDPDTFVAKFGADGLERVIASSLDVFDRKIQLLERGGWFSDLRRKRQALDRLLPTIRITADRLTRDLYLARTAEVAGVSRELLVRDLETGEIESEVSNENQAPSNDPDPSFDDGFIPSPRRRESKRVSFQSAPSPTERGLLRILVHHRRYVEAAADRVGPDMFVNPIYRMLFVQLCGSDPDLPVDELVARLDDELTALLQALLVDGGGLDRPDEMFKSYTDQFISRDNSNRLALIDRMLPVTNDEDEKDDLIREKRRLTIENQKVGRPRWKSFNSSRS